MDYIHDGYCGVYSGACRVILGPGLEIWMRISSATDVKAVNLPGYVRPVASRLAPYVRNSNSAFNAVN